MPQPLPPITPKQQEILKLLYRYRFLNRIHIQQLLNHKDKRRIISWLKDLRSKQYVDWHYNGSDFTAKTKPGIYYLSLNGIRNLRSTGNYPAEALRKRYKEPTRKQSYIDTCLLIAECCIILKNASNDAVRFEYFVEADYIDPSSELYYLNELHPHLCFTKQEDDTVKHYLLELFSSSTPRHAVKKRLKDYVDYLVSDDWQDHMQTDKPPIILLALEKTSELLYAKRRLRYVLEHESDELKAAIRLSTFEKIRQNGVNGLIWEEV